MSEASRAAALAHAAMVHQGSGDAAAALETAESFHSFIAGDAPPAAQTKATKPAGTAAKKTATKAATKPAPEDTDADAEAEGGEEGEVTKEQVGAAVEALLNANMRDQVIALFKKYKAKSLSSVKEEDYASIKQDAEDLMLNS
jgi:hypothetical protein